MSKLYHGMLNHLEHLKKRGKCPYCLTGSKPVPDCLMGMSDAQIAEELPIMMRGSDAWPKNA